jgi:hypothetical protein
MGGKLVDQRAQWGFCMYVTRMLIDSLFFGMSMITGNPFDCQFDEKKILVSIRM